MSSSARSDDRRGLVGLPAPAKLNLFLHVVGRRDDGRHNLQTLFRLLDYGDELDFAVRGDGGIRVHCEGAEIDEASNLVTRAAGLLKRAGGVASGADVRLRKRIPPGSGLGGGSSDAATTLCALNVLWGCGLDVASLSELGFSLGADVPLFVRGHSAWAEGAGERLTPVALPDAWYLVLVPRVAVATADLFAAPELTRSAAPITMHGYRSGQGANVFEPLVRQRFPQVAQALDWLDRYCGVRGGRPGGARLSGTGCGVFAEFDSREQALAALAARPDGVDGFAARGLDVSPLSQSLEQGSASPAGAAVGR